MSARSSPKRRGPPLRCQMMLGVQAPPKSFMHSVKGQPGGAGRALLLRTGSGNTRSCWLPSGYFDLSVTASNLVFGGNRAGLTRVSLRGRRDP